MIPLAKTFPEIFERSMIQYLKLKVTECSGCRLKVRSNMCSPREGGGGGVLLGILGGGAVCSPVLQILTRF